MKQYILTKEDAMKFEFYNNAIDFNYENLYGEWEVGAHDPKGQSVNVYGLEFDQ